MKLPFEYFGYSIMRLNKYNLTIKKDGVILGYYGTLKQALSDLMGLLTEEGQDVEQIRGIIKDFEQVVQNTLSQAI